MRLLVVSDLHGDLDPARRACIQVRPDLILSCGDWGDAGEVAEPDLKSFLEIAPVYTTFGNHDSLELLSRLHNRDGSAVLLAQGAVHCARRPPPGGDRGHLGKVAFQASLRDGRRRGRGRGANRPIRSRRHLAHSRLPDRAGRHDAVRPPWRPALLPRCIKDDRAAPAPLRALARRAGAHAQGRSQGDQRRRRPPKARSSSSNLTRPKTRCWRAWNRCPRRETARRCGIRGQAAVAPAPRLAPRRVGDFNRGRSLCRTPRDRACKPRRWCERCRSRSSSAAHLRYADDSAPRSAGAET